MSNKKDVKKTEVLDSVTEFKNELEALRAELKSLREEKKNFSDEVKDAVDAARDEMITDEDEQGTLFIDPKYKEDGYVYRIVDTGRPGRVQSLIKKGYEIVYDEYAKIGDGRVTNVGSLTDAVTTELSVHGASRTGVLMRCPKEHYDKRQAAKVKRTKELDAAMFQTAVNQSDFGSIEIGDDLYKK